MRDALEQTHRRQNHARRTHAALRASVNQESLLHGVELAGVGDAFNRADIRALGLQRWHQAAIHQRAVHDHGTGAALALAATFLGSGELHLFAQHVQQPGHRIDAGLARNPVDRAAQLNLHNCSGVMGAWSTRKPVACSTAFRMAGAGPSIGSSPIPFAPDGPYS